jgi:hypothetical protein
MFFVPNRCIAIDQLGVTQDEERLATLGELERARLALLQSLSSLPFVIDTPTLEARKANLEVILTPLTLLLHLPGCCTCPPTL